jgi:hypothetical protein
MAQIAVGEESPMRFKRPTASSPSLVPALSAPPPNDTRRDGRDRAGGRRLTPPPDARARVASFLDREDVRQILERWNGSERSEGASPR